MVWEAKEKSLQDSSPIELYKFVGSVNDYFFTSCGKDIEHSGDTYVNIPIRRTAHKAGAVQFDSSIEIILPTSTQLVQDYAFGIAPSELTLEIYRLQGEDVQRIWKGNINTLAPKGHLTHLRSPSPLTEALTTVIPAVGYQVMCNHRLGDARCGVDLGPFTIPASVVSIDDRATTITTDLSLTDNEFFVGGELVRVSDGDRRQILKQEMGTGIVKIDWPFRTLDNSDAVELIAGCAHIFDVCRTKFGNIENFGGHNFIPAVNLFRTWNGIAGTGGVKS